jgi:putative Ca2+/H+ antiporter (TMEM165/GDT1 family)
MYEFLISTSIVALAEMGDKTQLLALLLAARFRKPVPILIAILLATTINHGISAVLGQWITTVLSPEILLWILALGFIGMAIWMLIPDELGMKLKVLINGKNSAYLVQLLFYFSWLKLVIKPKLLQLL